MAHIKAADSIFDQSSANIAFGRDRLGGDETAAREMAADLTAIYAAFLVWGLRTRGALVSPNWKPVCEKLAELVRLPIDCIREFSERVTKETEEFFGIVRSGRHPGRPLTLTLRLTLDSTAREAALEAFRRVVEESR